MTQEPDIEAIELQPALDRLKAFAQHQNIWAAYHDFPSPMVTMSGDLRAVLPLLEAALRSHLLKGQRP